MPKKRERRARPPVRTFEERTFELLSKGYSIALIDLVNAQDGNQAENFTRELLAFPDHLVPRLNATYMRKLQEMEEERSEHGVGDNS